MDEDTLIEAGNKGQLGNGEENFEKEIFLGNLVSQIRKGLDLEKTGFRAVKRHCRRGRVAM